MIFMRYINKFELKSQKKVNKSPLLSGAGFSLIELLVGIAIIITTSTIVLSIIVSSFRISSKTTASSTVRQNGNYALAQMTRQLKFADSFQGAHRAGSPVIDNPCGVGVDYDQVDIKQNKEDVSIVCSDDEISVDGENSIDTNNIQIGSCSLTCSQAGSEGPVITIDFDLAIGDADTAIEDRASIDFSTTVKMRN